MHTWFISDLHLHESRPHLTRAFFDFLHTKIAANDQLYILGDFFDAWIGDDDDAPLNTQVALELSQLNKKGTAIFFMHGNRDFLLGNAFATQAGGQLIDEGTVIDLYGTPTLLLHGDNLCTDDKEYMAFRQQVRSPQWQAQVLSQPLAARRALAAQLREKSKAMSSLKADDITDVNSDAVVTAMKNAQVLQLIHGHTHRPARHALVINNHAAERIVLGDWHHKAWAIVADQQSLNLIDWDISEA